MHAKLARILTVAAIGIASAVSATAASASDVGILDINSAADLCAHVGHNAGFPNDRLVTAVAVALAESRCNPDATGTNTDGSRDRGLWQINSRWHPEVSDACAYDAQCNANEAYRISSQGTSWTPWTTYNSGAYTSWLDEARAAVDRLQTGPTSVIWRQSNYTTSSGGWSFGWGGEARTRCAPITGDWDGDGDDSPGLACFDSTNGWSWIQTNYNASSGSTTFGWGGTARAYCYPITGDWDGDGDTTVGLACPTSNGWAWHQTNYNASSGSTTFGWGGVTSDTTYPITGDWDGDGDTTVGLARLTSNGWSWGHTNYNASSGSWSYGWGSSTLTNAIPITGDWDGNGTTSIGLATHTSNGWIWRHSNYNTSSSGWSYGWGSGTLSASYYSPITGDWDGDGDTSIGIVSAKRR